jgi:hypothetical protein
MGLTARERGSRAAVSRPPLVGADVPGPRLFGHGLPEGDRAGRAPGPFAPAQLAPDRPAAPRLSLRAGGLLTCPEVLLAWLLCVLLLN